MLKTVTKVIYRHLINQKEFLEQCRNSPILLVGSKNIINVLHKIYYLYLEFYIYGK